MEINANLGPPGRGRDLRLDWLRGLANLAIFLDHIPHSVVNWVTTRNYGASDAADLFVFISGYTAAFVYGRVMAERGLFYGATRIFKRVRQLYITHVLLLVIYIAAVGYVVETYEVSDLAREFNIESFVTHSVDTLSQGLLLNFKPLNLDILPLYILLMAFFPPVLWILLRKPDLTLLLSLLLYFAARQFGWNFAAYPVGMWTYNPFCWQLLFVFGAWFALGGVGKSRPVIYSPVVLYCGIAYLLSSLVLTVAGRFPVSDSVIPRALIGAFSPGDQTDLTPYRVLHFLVIALLVVRFAPKQWRGLQWPIFDPVIKCGQSIAVFCVGLFLSFVVQFVLMINYVSLLLQIVLAFLGVAIMVMVAYGIAWSKKQDELLLRRPRSVTPH